MKKRYAPDDADQSEAKRQNKGKTKDGRDVATNNSTLEVQASAPAKKTLKKVSFAPNPSMQDIYDEEQAPLPKRKSRRPRQNFLDFISGIPPNPPPIIKSRERRGVAPAPLLASAAIARPGPSTAASIEKSVSLAAEGIATIDFADARLDTASSKIRHSASVGKSRVKETEKLSAQPKSSTPLSGPEEMQLATPSSTSLIDSQTDDFHPGSVLVFDSAAGYRDNSLSEELYKPSRDKCPNGGTKEFHVPHKRVAELRHRVKPSSVVKRKVTAKRSPSATLQSRYGLRVRRKTAESGDEEEVQLEREQ